MQNLTPERVRIINKLKRRDINPIVEAELLAVLTRPEDGLTQPEIAEVLGYSQPRISNSVRLLNLSPLIIGLIRSGALNFSDGKALICVPDADAERFAKLKITERWSTKQLEEAIRDAGISRRDNSRRPGRKPA